MICDIIQQENLRAFGDIAYNNAPFTAVIPQVFPDAKLIVLVRDGRDFVRSVYTSERPDPLPVGWLDADTELTDLEKYVAFGRLRPVPGLPDHACWNDMTAVQKNAWLWSETYRIIIDGLSAWNDTQTMIVRAEDFFADVEGTYRNIRCFLGFKFEMSRQTKSLLTSNINKRSSKSSYVLPHHSNWNQKTQCEFWSEAEMMMHNLGYR